MITIITAAAKRVTEAEEAAIYLGPWRAERQGSNT
jgi:hypothetical protein